MLAIIRKIEMDPDVVWHGTDEQADEYDRQCDECAECWRKIIEDPNFSALGFQYDTDYHILSRSTDDKGVFRLTYFWNGKKPNGKTYIMDPTMHENYNGKEDNYRGSGISLLDILSGFCHKEDLTIEIA